MRISDWSSDVCSSDLTKLDANGQGSPYATYGFAAQIAEVAVDLDLGTVKVLRMAAAHDVGRAVNPTLVEGQIHGGIAQGLGLALMEEYLPGRTENLHDYLIPTFGDMPEITCILVEDPERSEEHTSELQSLMRISYAVFCLKKKTIHT